MVTYISETVLPHCLMFSHVVHIPQAPSTHLRLSLQYINEPKCRYRVLAEFNVVEGCLPGAYLPSSLLIRGKPQTERSLVALSTTRLLWLAFRFFTDSKSLCSNLNDKMIAEECGQTLLLRETA
jgi:hypothetical protein